jgi:hypothetical protein
LGGLGGGTTATGTEETIDLAAASPSFSEHPAFSVRRSYHNTSWLPDGGLVTVGGGAGKPEGSLYDVDSDGAQHQVELYDPVAESWRLGPAQQSDRAYHSVALLLPDGRIWSSGDDDPRDGKDHETYETYRPPYLYRGARPSIAWAPQQVGWGQQFAIHTGGAPVTRAALIAPYAVTHAADMNSRYAPLEVEEDADHAGRVTLTAPTSRTAFPPGYYMLFALTADGVPSVAAWVRLTDVGEPVPAEPELPAPPPAPATAPASVPAAAAGTIAGDTSTSERGVSPTPARVPTPAARPATTETPALVSKRALAADTARRALARGWVYVAARRFAPSVVQVRVGGRLAAERRVTARRSLRISLPAWTHAPKWRTRAVVVTVWRVSPASGR